MSRIFYLHRRAEEDEEDEETGPKFYELCGVSYEDPHTYAA